MKALARTRDWVWLFRRQPLTIRLLAAAAGLLTVAAAFAAPAEADPNDDNFIDALNHAGVDFGEPGNAMAMGESDLPDARPAGRQHGRGRAARSGAGLSPGMAQMFTTIAIQTYCPTEMANIANGNLSGLPQVPGMPGGMPGMPGGMPGMPGACPASQASNASPADRWSTLYRSSPPRPSRS